MFEFNENNKKRTIKKKNSLGRISIGFIEYIVKKRRGAQSNITFLRVLADIRPDDIVYAQRASGSLLSQ